MEYQQDCKKLYLKRKVNEQYEYGKGKNMDEKVIVVTVTFNSSSYLERLLKALLNETVNLYRIVVVDNNSKQEHIDKINYLKKMSPIIDMLFLKENLGGAGGFEKGVQYALDNYSEGHWIWLMDDDAFPKEDCLENLLKYKTLNNVGCLAPVIYGVEWKKYQLYHHKNVTKYLNDGIAICESIEQLGEYTPFETDAFVGPLIKMNVIRDIGIPDGSLFIYGDDREYTYRITRKYRMLLIRDAVIYHRDTTEDEISIWKMYYKFRNKFLFIKKYRNTKIQKFIGEWLVFYEMYKEFVKLFARNKYIGNKRKYIKYLLKAFKDGVLEKKGKIVDPSNF